MKTMRRLLTLATVVTAFAMFGCRSSSSTTTAGSVTNTTPSTEQMASSGDDTSLHPELANGDERVAENRDTLPGDNSPTIILPERTKRVKTAQVTTVTPTYT